MAEKVQWIIDSLFKGIDAQKVYEEIGSTNVTAEEVLAKAENPDSELHKCFCWDDTEAARKYRLLQAGDVIRKLVITPVVEEQVPIRAFQISSETHTYQPTRMFVYNIDEHQILLKRAYRELEAFKQRYKMLTELDEVFALIDNIL